jgi:pyruvate/2-oxoglutarate/acetoin dehydrogenase E1 component
MQIVIDSLNAALRTALEMDKQVLLLGEDILDPYGGAFKVSRGLSTEFPEQVLATPISEAGIVGIATGLALDGFRPIVEIMFGDFITLTADQIINHASKFRFMYNNQVHVPIVIRTPMGGRRGYGPTHSQTLDKLFLGVPGLKIFAPNIFINPGDLLINAIFSENDPVLFIENKIQYSQRLVGELELNDFTITRYELMENNINPTSEAVANPIQLSVRGIASPNLTIATYGYMAELCYQAAQRLAFEEEIFLDIIVFSQLLPIEISSLYPSLHKSGRLLVVEEGTITAGWGSEILASSIEQFKDLDLKAMRVASPDQPIPASWELEQSILPSIEDIILAVKKMV